jgi:alkylated DNA repair dioxygenase AlkB
MNTLFDLEPISPSGFSYIPNFITQTEEVEFSENASSIDVHSFNFHGYEAKRKVASFGYDWNFENRTLSKGTDIPLFFNPVLEKVALYLTLKPEQFVEVLLTEYPVGSVINWHRDAPPFDIIAGISLLSDCVFRFRPYDKKKQGRGSIISIPVKRRSLYIIQGPSRTDWEHSILPVKEKRYSITLRTLKDDPLV